VYFYTVAMKPLLPSELVNVVNVVNLALGAEALETRLLAKVLDKMKPDAQTEMRDLAKGLEADTHILQGAQGKLAAYLTSCEGEVYDDQMLVERLLVNLQNTDSTRARYSYLG
jgi:hypothetical protein